MLDRRVHLTATLLGLLSLSFATHAVAQGRQQRQDHGWYVVGAIANSTISVCDIFGCLYPDSNSPDTGLATPARRRGETRACDIASTPPAFGGSSLGISRSAVAGAPTCKAVSRTSMRAAE